MEELRGFNCPDFVREFRDYVVGRGFRTVLEVGCLSGELRAVLVEAGLEVDGIDLEPRVEGVIKADIREFRPGKVYDLVFSSGVLEHYADEEIKEILKAMARVGRFILNYVPNRNCEAYRRAKERTVAEWRDERDFTLWEFFRLHEEAGLEIPDAGYAGEEWAKRFGPEESEPYLVFCLARVPSYSEKIGKRSSKGKSGPSGEIGR